MPPLFWGVLLQQLKVLLSFLFSHVHCPFLFLVCFCDWWGLWKLLFLCPFVTDFGIFSLTWLKLGSFFSVPSPPFCWVLSLLEVARVHHFNVYLWVVFNLESCFNLLFKECFFLFLLKHDSKPNLIIYWHPPKIKFISKSIKDLHAHH
jgi:hypothetical protein